MSSHLDSMTVAQVAKKTRVMPDAMRYYCRIGLLRPRRDRRSGYKRFTGMDIQPLETLQRHVDRASNRLSFSLIIASIVVASSIVMSYHPGPHFEGIPLLGLAGYAIAAVLGLSWAVATLRSGRLRYLQR